MTFKCYLRTFISDRRVRILERSEIYEVKVTKQDLRIEFYGVGTNRILPKTLYRCFQGNYLGPYIMPCQTGQNYFYGFKFIPTSISDNPTVTSTSLYRCTLRGHLRSE